MTPTASDNSDKPSSSEPSSSEPTSNEPTSNEPTSNEPAANEPAASAPATSGQPSEKGEPPIYEASSIRTPRKPLIPRKIWILATASERVTNAVAAIKAAGHDVRTAESAAELAPALKEFRPDIIMIDMLDEPDRGRHVALQLRADRATRQLPIVLVSARDMSLTQGEKTITGPTRRYALGLDAPSVLNAVLTEL